MQRLHVFDLDHTLITANSTLLFSRILLRQKILSLPAFIVAAFYYFRHRYFGLSLSDLHHHLFGPILKGLHRDCLAAPIDQLIREQVAGRLNAPAVSALRFAQQMGDMTAIFSSSPDFLVEAVARLLHVDTWRATTYRMNGDHTFAAIATILDGETKAVDLRSLRTALHLKKEDVTVYSDSLLDLPFLLEAGVPVAVSPDPQLKKFALEHHWSII